MLEQLGAVVQRFVAGKGEADIHKWSNAVDLTATRTGFLICNDLDVAARLVQTEPVSIGVGRAQGQDPRSAPLVDLGGVLRAARAPRPGHRPGVARGVRLGDAASASLSPPLALAAGVGIWLGRRAAHGGGAVSAGVRSVTAAIAARRARPSARRSCAPPRSTGARGAERRRPRPRRPRRARRRRSRRRRRGACEASRDAERAQLAERASPRRSARLAPRGAPVDARTRRRRRAAGRDGRARPREASRARCSERAAAETAPQASDAIREAEIEEARIAARRARARRRRSCRRGRRSSAASESWGSRRAILRSLPDGDACHSVCRSAGEAGAALGRARGGQPARDRERRRRDAGRSSERATPCASRASTAWGARWRAGPWPGCIREPAPRARSGDGDPRGAREIATALDARARRSRPARLHGCWRSRPRTRTSSSWSAGSTTAPATRRTSGSTPSRRPSCAA